MKLPNMNILYMSNIYLYMPQRSSTGLAITVMKQFNLPKTPQTGYFINKLIVFLKILNTNTKYRNIYWDCNCILRHQITSSNRGFSAHHTLMAVLRELDLELAVLLWPNQHFPRRQSL